MSLLAPSWPATSSSLMAGQPRHPIDSTSAFPLAAADLVGRLEVLHARMALDALRGHLLAAEERPLDELDVLEMPVLVNEVAVRRLGAVDRRCLAAVARRAAELLGWMLGEQQLAMRMGLPRVRLVLETRLVDARVARHAAVDTRRSEEHTSELQSPCNLVCRLLLEKKKQQTS